jgi:hypothetical protein
MSGREHTSHHDASIVLSQSHRDRAAVWEQVRASVVNAGDVSEAIRREGYYVLPADSTAMLRIGYQPSPVGRVDYFDLGEVQLDADTQVTVAGGLQHALVNAGPTITFTLDSEQRRDLYRSGEGHEALEEEKDLARTFMKLRTGLLDQPNFRLKIGSIAQVRLVTRASGS